MKQSPSIAIATLRYALLAMTNIQLILSEYLACNNPNTTGWS
ncbi:MAG: hypothetical protein AAF378_19230 [Cyanobacteria bacterium P01_A01_bin.84]